MEPVLLNQEQTQLDLERIPEHIAIIMDGNRRWAKKNRRPVEMGHWQGAEVITDLVTAAKDLGVKVLTLYAFSTENWGRSDFEIKMLMRLFRIYLVRKRASLIKQGVKLSTIGDTSKFPENVQKVLRDTKEATKDGDQIELVLALNYGARDEIMRGVLKASQDLAKGKIHPESFTEEVFASYLDTAPWKDPELLIRPSGESRLSNFLFVATFLC